jgi:hypothetical protein
MTICSGGSCFVTGAAGCFHQRDPEGGMTGGSGGADCAEALASKPPRSAEAIAVFATFVVSEASSPPKLADATTSLETFVVAEASSPPRSAFADTLFFALA